MVGYICTDRAASTPALVRTSHIAHVTFSFRKRRVKTHTQIQTHVRRFNQARSFTLVSVCLC